MVKNNILAIIDGYRVLTYRDLNESAAEQENYLRHMEHGDKSYTKEGFEKTKYYINFRFKKSCCNRKKTMNQSFCNLMINELIF